MKNYKKLTLLTIASIAILATIMSFKTGDFEKEIIIVRVMEIPSGMFSSSIVVTDAYKTLKTVELETAKPKNMEVNLIKITAVLNEYRQKGYRLITSNTSNGTNYVFEKE